MCVYTCICVYLARKSTFNLFGSIVCDRNLIEFFIQINNQLSFFLFVEFFFLSLLIPYVSFVVELNHFIKWAVFLASQMLFRDLVSLHCLTLGRFTTMS